MTIHDLVGDYTVAGNNQNAENTSYKGTLSLILDNNQIRAKWIINNEQEQSGVGFFKNDILVINFNYIGNDNKIYEGIVVYKCLTPDILEGFWSEPHGNPLFLGKERCFRINIHKTLLD